MSTVMTEDIHPLTIVLSGGNAARLFGLPFLLIGVYLGYHLILALYALLTGQAAISEFLFGTLVLIFMTAAFLVPGWVLIFSRARVEIDRTARTVAYVRDLRVYQHREQRQLSEFDRIEIDLLNRRAKGRAFKAQLAGKRPAKVTVGVFDESEEAMSFGHRLGSLLGLPVRDLSETEPEED